MIPETLDGWTLEVVRRLVDQGVFETDRFDFKEMLPHSKDEEGKRRLRRDTAAFANSAGGFLVFGVKDAKGVAPADRVVGMLVTVDFPEHFGNYPSACEPSVEWAAKNPPIPLGADRVIPVVHVPRSSRRPHGVFEDGRWWFCKRTNKGTEPMSLGELRDAFSTTREKLAKLRALTEQVQYLHDRAREVNARASNGGRQSRWRGSHPDAYDDSVVTALWPEVLDLLAHDDTVLRQMPALRAAVRKAEEGRAVPWLAKITQMNDREAARWFGGAAREVVRVSEILLPRLRKAESDASR
ncbi:MAG TPA: ATP-binding protein [Polyangiaceae bacterium]